MKDKLLKIFLVINTIILIISFSISVVILYRPFYYHQISSLKLVEKTGYTYHEIKEAYDDVLDYLTFNKSFSAGKLKYSEDGYNHFKDCKNLFVIDFLLLGLSTIIYIIQKKKYNKIKIINHSIEFWSSSITLSFIIILLLTSFLIGFNKCFTIFHSIFFFGKDNWLFDSNIDEIIDILPEEYFMNCGIFIILIMCLISILFIITELYNRKRNN